MISLAESARKYYVANVDGESLDAIRSCSFTLLYIFRWFERRVFKSFINGNNGEFTGTDDLDVYNQRHVRVVEARNGVMVEPEVFQERPAGRPRARNVRPRQPDYECYICNTMTTVRAGAKRSTDRFTYCDNVEHDTCTRCACTSYLQRVADYRSGVNMHEGAYLRCPQCRAQARCSRAFVESVVWVGGPAPELPEAINLQNQMRGGIPDIEPGRVPLPEVQQVFILDDPANVPRPNNVVEPHVNPPRIPPGNGPGVPPDNGDGGGPGVPVNPVPPILEVDRGGGGFPPVVANGGGGGPPIVDGGILGPNGPNVNPGGGPGGQPPIIVMGVPVPPDVPPGNFDGGPPPPVVGREAPLPPVAPEHRPPSTAVVYLVFHDKRTFWQRLYDFFYETLVFLFDAVLLRLVLCLIVPCVELYRYCRPEFTTVAFYGSTAANPLYTATRITRRGKSGGYYKSMYDVLGYTHEERAVIYDQAAYAVLIDKKGMRLFLDSGIMIDQYVSHWISDQPNAALYDNLTVRENTAMFVLQKIEAFQKKMEYSSCKTQRSDVGPPRK